MPKGVRRTAYESSDGLRVVLEVPEPPMGVESGYIPPPVVTFYKDGAIREFTYRGSE